MLFGVVCCAVLCWALLYAVICCAVLYGVLCVVMCYVLCQETAYLEACVVQNDSAVWQELGILEW